MTSNRFLVATLVVAGFVVAGLFIFSEHLLRKNAGFFGVPVVNYQGKELFIGVNFYPEVNKYIVTGTVDNAVEQDGTVEFIMKTEKESLNPFSKNEKSVVIEVGKTLILEHSTEDQDVHVWKSDYSIQQIVDLLVSGVPVSVMVPSEKEAGRNRIIATHVIVHTYAER